jgi:hypothetical protein
MFQILIHFVCVCVFVLNVCVCSCYVCVCFCNMYLLTFSVFCLCTYLYCFLFFLFCSCSCFVLCIFIFVCTSVGLLPPGESPIAVSSSSSNIHFRNVLHETNSETPLGSVHLTFLSSSLCVSQMKTKYWKSHSDSEYTYFKKIYYLRIFNIWLTSMLVYWQGEQEM